MFWSDLWGFIKNNLLMIVLVAVLITAIPWTIIFVLPVAIIFLILYISVWRVRRAQQQMYDEVRREAGEQQQRQQSWWRKSKSEGEVTVVRTEPTEQRVSDDVGEYVEFKEIKEEDTK